MIRLRATCTLVAACVCGSLFLGSAPAVAENDELLAYTTYTIDQGNLALGLLSIDYGILEGLSVGTDPPAWAARVATPFWIPNLHVKWAFIRTPEFRLAAQLGAYAGGPNRSRNDVSFLAVPVSLFASAPLTSRLEGHLEGTYGYAYAWGTGSPGDLTIEGAVAANVLQFGALLTYRVSDLFRLTLRGRFQAYASPVVLRGDTRLDERTTAHMEVELEPEGLIHWMAAPGVAFLWTRVHLWLGVGYGNFFLPGVIYPLPDRNIVPEGTVYVIF
jgi:hypothetical protein